MDALQITENLAIPAWELAFEFVRSSGPGGQNVNKVNSKAQLRWNVLASPSLPEEVRQRFRAHYGSRLTKAGEVVLSSDRFRDRGRNMDDCLAKLRELLQAVAKAPKRRKPTRPTRSSQLRRRDSKRRQGEKKQGRSRPRWDS